MKKTIHTNHRVEVNPEMPWAFRSSNNPDERARAAAAACERVRQEIRRHCDGVEWCGVMFDTVEICSLCGEPWSEDEDGPACCDAALAEWKERNNG